MKRNSFFIFLIIVFALLLRLYFFIGFAWGDPQDDAVYLNIAKQILKTGFYDHHAQKRLVLTETTVNPVYIFPSRLAFIYPLVLSLCVFGVNDYAAALFPLLCSLFSIYCVFKIGTLLFDHRIGWLSGFVLAIFPLDIIYATRVTPDVPVACFMVVSIFLFLKGLKQNKSLWLLISGMVVGVGYLIKETATVALVIMMLWLLKEKISWRKAFYVCLGFIFVLLLESTYYQLSVGCLFLRPLLISKVYKFKYMSEWIDRTVTYDLGWVSIQYLIGSILVQLKTLLSIYRPTQEVNYFGYFYYAIFFSFCYLLFKRFKNVSFIILWFALIYLYAEFGPIHITLNLKPPFIVYDLIEKQPRYMSILIAPSVILFSIFLAYIKMPFKKVCTFILMGFLLLSSYRCASSTQKYFREHTKDIREITTFLQALMPRRVYADWISIEQIYFYSGFTFNNLHNINDIINNPGKDCYVVLGGSRGAGLVADYFEKDYLQLIYKIPGHWIALKTIHGTRDSFRHRDITVYYVPNDKNIFSSTNEQNL